MFSGKHHVTFQNTTSEFDFGGLKFDEELVENATGCSLTLVESVVAIVNDLGFNDGYDVGVLAELGIGGENATVGLDGVFGGGGVGDVKGGTPFGEAKTRLIVSPKTGREVFEAFGVGFEGVEGLGLWGGEAGVRAGIGT